MAWTGVGAVDLQATARQGRIPEAAAKVATATTDWAGGSAPRPDGEVTHPPQGPPGLLEEGILGQLLLG